MCFLDSKAKQIVLRNQSTLTVEIMTENFPFSEILSLLSSSTGQIVSQIHNGTGFENKKEENHNSKT